MATVNQIPTGEEFTLKVRVAKSEVSDHSYYGEHFRYRLEVLDGPDDIATGLDWVEVRQPVDGTTILASPDRKARIAQRNAEEGPTREDLEALTRNDLVARAKEAGVKASGKSAEIVDRILAA